MGWLSGLPNVVWELLKVSDAISGGPWGQNYFKNNTFSPLYCSHEFIVDFPEEEEGHEVNEIEEARGSSKIFHCVVLYFYFYTIQMYYPLKYIS